MMKKKQVILLIGPKGSGKTFIGSFIQERFGIRFLRVEDWAKAIKKSREVTDEVYLAEVFDCIETGVRKALLSSDHVVFESTGLTDHFDRMLASFRNDCKVTTIGISANSALCLQRVRSRNSSIHIAVSDDMVLQINEKVEKKDIETDFQIVNEDLSLTALQQKLNKMLVIDP